MSLKFKIGQKVHYMSCNGAFEGIYKGCTGDWHSVQVSKNTNILAQKVWAGPKPEHIPCPCDTCETAGDCCFKEQQEKDFHRGKTYYDGEVHNGGA